jgi:hypothetical protein
MHRDVWADYVGHPHDTVELDIFQVYSALYHSPSPELI